MGTGMGMITAPATMSVQPKPTKKILRMKTSATAAQ
jgi:hypothetical protein